MKKTAAATVMPVARASNLNSLRHAKMAESAHAYVRGSTGKFYEWLGNTPRANVPEGPPVWICGDCHVGNLGPIAGLDGSLNIAIRDLDQTVIGNPAHDMMRLSLSLAMAARGSDLPGVTTAHMLEYMMDGYLAGLADPETDVEVCYPDILGVALRRAAGRSWKHVADEHIEGVAPTIPLGKRFWLLADDERNAISVAFERNEVRALVISLRPVTATHRFESWMPRIGARDAARWESCAMPYSLQSAKAETSAIA
ncbi:DUF2252 family protein [Acidisphaera sp. L21]|uniref:DUF2252 family protein n=1 Tax=Acidisphaera sp. L21 TaxID=1641851 RepID=UPI001C204BC1|nr:DUF2252 family protein [Acidisphaera sp. L21]